MIEEFETKKLAEYVINAIEAIKKPKTLNNICDWFFEEGCYALDKIKINNKLCVKDEGRLKIENVHEFLEDISNQLKTKYLNKKIKESSIEKTLNYIQTAIGVGEKETKLLGVFYRYDTCDVVSDFIDSIKRRTAMDFYTMADKTITAREYVQLKNHLKEFGLYGEEGYRSDNITDFTRNLFEHNYKNYDDFIQKIVGQNQKTSLCWNDYSYMENINYAADLIKSALKNKEKGVNLLFYGVPGTGKTEFAKVIAKKIKAKCFSIGEEDNNLGCEETHRDFRYAKFIFMQRMLEHENNTFLIMDEAEDILYQDRLKKIQINRMLEQNQLPVIWITNRTFGADGAFLRRFSMAFPFKELDDHIKMKIWSKTFAKNGITVETEKVKSLIHDYQVPVSFVASAARNAKITEKGIDIVEASLKSMQSLCFGDKSTEAEYTGVVDFDPGLLNTDTDLSKLSDQLLKKGKLNFSLCLYGVSGTGKSAYGVWLAKKLGLKTIKIRCSDIMDKYVGESEQNIKRAFAKAKREKAVLIFDEADSFLQDRTGAQCSWEITGVNEMLTQMENHPYPFICTTNLLNKLDKASLRRFTFKVKYDYLTPEQSSKAFQTFFKIPNVELKDLEKLTPADFANAWKKADFMDITDKDELIKLIKDEQDVREPVKYKLGF